MKGAIYTVGHSTHACEFFIGLLLAHGITAVADVRSTPYSRRNPQFNRDNLRDALKANDVQYAFLGQELGARSADDSCYINDKVCYGLLAKTRLFESGIERLAAGAAAHRIALMCAEREPLDCHRTILVSRRLVLGGFPVMHILADGSVETHDAALGRLVSRLKLTGEDLFRSQSITAEEAYEKQADRIAFDRSLHRRDTQNKNPPRNR